MRPSTLFELIAILLVNYSLLSANVQAQAKPDTYSTISGKITIKGKPAAGVLVALGNADGEVTQSEKSLRGTTDQDGRFRINKIPAGSYTIQAVKPAYVLATSSEFGKRSIIVGESENIEDVNFSLAAGGVITGKVTDNEGRPVIFETVSIFYADAFGRNVQLKPEPVYASFTVETDDRGVYRAFGLPAGKYKVAAAHGAEIKQKVSVGSAEHHRFKQVFYPDAQDHSNATIIEVTEGSEVTDIDIVLGPQLQAFSASGRVIDAESGLPIPNIRFALLRFRNPNIREVLGSFVATDQKGEFTVDGLVAGSYSVLLSWDEKPTRRVDSEPFEIVDQNITGVVIKLGKGTSISGAVVLQNDDQSAQSKLGHLTIQASVKTTDPAGSNSFRSTMVSADGNFYLGGLGPGLARLYVGRYDDSGESYSITRIERDGVVQPKSFEIKDSDQVTGLRVFVISGDSTLKGVVTLKNGTLPPNGKIFVNVIPTSRVDGVREAVIDNRGHFILQGLIPAVYNIEAGVLISNSAAPNSTRQQVTIGPGTTELNLTVDLSTLSTPQPKP